MDIGDIVIANTMKRYIILGIVNLPSTDYQVVEFGRQFPEQVWYRLACIRFGDVIIAPAEFLRFFKVCEKHEFVQAIENAQPADRVYFNDIKKILGDYKCAKSDIGSIFIK